MEKSTTSIFRNATFCIGLGAIALSLGIFMLPEIFSISKSSGTDFGIFILNYLIAIAYFIIVWVREIPKFSLENFQQKVEFGFIHLILCLISAYSLNREIPVFEQSTSWLQIALVIQGVVLLLTFFLKQFTGWVQFTIWIMLGIVFSLFLYFVIFLIPLYPIGILASVGFGFSLHAFVPLWIVLALVIFIIRKDNRTKSNLIGFGTGIIISLALVCVALIQWNNLNKIITKASDHSLLDEKNDLPEWVVIAQQMPQSKLSEKFLKTELVYSTAPDVEDWGFFRMPSRNFDEVKKHDPITMLTTFILDKPNLTEDSKINILQAMYDSRHKAQERLWSGTDLTTGHILTNIRLYPSLRLSYTEKFITIHSNLSPKMWRPEQEAIYTFHLPEGSVVTSLSLWINGKEEKSILTSKNKADTAYKTIVGIERHDPSLVRWQEGNTVSVRVFPCTPNEDRRFKIGITTPLRAENNKLAYENIWFDGPDASSATENCKVHTMESLKTINLPQNFNEDAINTWVYEGNYIADHRIEIPILPISNNAFTFDGNTYRISNCEKTFENFDLQNIYLDINKQWTQDELLRILEIAKNKTIYVFQNQLLKIDDSNANKLFEQLTKYNFSVFPIYEIKDPDRSILISKGTLSSPNVSDLGDCDFANKLTEYVLSNKKIRLFNLNRELSPYLKTLKELRVFTYDYGDISYLNPLISGNKFIKNQENSHTIVLNDAGIKITESPDTIPSNAPDHLMRLFSYNNVMYSTGVNYFKKDFYNEDIVNKAYKAYVVSPVTSLIVLETKQDYERFGIKDEGSSLKNASMKSSGAVPEPHEWLLILLLASIAGYLYFHKKKNTIINQI